MKKLVIWLMLIGFSLIYLCSYSEHRGDPDLSGGEDPFADEVTEFNPGQGAGFGQDYYPGNVLGAPHGNEDPQLPQSLPEHLLSLGDGGWIVLKFADSVLINGPGVDLAVFENPLIPYGQPEFSYSETAIISVSQDGVNFYTFPFDYLPPAVPGDFGKMSNYLNFAGVHPVLSNPTNGISPTDPVVSGGDFFDLQEVGLAWAQYVKIQDTGYPGTATETVDWNGDAVDDPGNEFTDYGSGKIGFDLDAIAAIHSASSPPTAASSKWILYQ